VTRTCPPVTGLQNSPAKVRWRRRRIRTSWELSERLDSIRAVQ